MKKKKKVFAWHSNEALKHSSRIQAFFNILQKIIKHQEKRGDFFASSSNQIIQTTQIIQNICSQGNSRALSSSSQGFSARSSQIPQVRVEDQQAPKLRADSSITTTVYASASEDHPQVHRLLEIKLFKPSIKLRSSSFLNSKI